MVATLFRKLGGYLPNQKPLELDWRRISHGYRKVFYYDALPGKQQSESDQDFNQRLTKAEGFHLYLQTLDRYRVNEGSLRWRKGRGNEQKKVDIMIAVDMLKHTIRKNMDEAALVASDVDFRPLLDALNPAIRARQAFKKHVPQSCPTQTVLYVITN